MERNFNRAKSFKVKHKIKKQDSPITVTNFESVFFDEPEQNIDKFVRFSPNDPIMEEHYGSGMLTKSKTIKKINSEADQYPQDITCEGLI